MKWVNINEINSATTAFISFVLTLIEFFVLPYVLKIEISFAESLILFLLQFLVLEAVAERYGILSRIKDLVEKEKAVFKDRSGLPELNSYLEKAKKSIWVIALSYGVLLNVDSSVIERKYDDGCDVKLLLSDSDPDKNQETARMSGFSEAVLSRQITTSIEFIKKFKGTKSNKGGVIEGKLLPSFPGFGVFIIDGSTPEGEIKIELIPCGANAHERPNCIITRKEPRRYEQLIKHFTELWDVSKQI